MIPADKPIQRRGDAKLLVIDKDAHITHTPRSAFVEFLRPGDLVVANDSVTIPGSLAGIHQPSGQVIEVRLAGAASLARSDRICFVAIVFGAGDFRAPTEHRSPPPSLSC